ncbi:MAG: phosphoglycerate kinase [Bdellovibrionales bacterium]|nr:phosphoglycerate kinase [Bdellovibrionales bacterium]
MREKKLKTLKEFDFKDKNVFMRVDFNVPLQGQVIQDPYRIEKSFASIEFILKQGGRLLLASHLGRPKGRDLSLSLRTVAQYLSEKKNLEVLFIEEPDSLLPKKLLKGLKSPQVILLENLRFHRGEENLDKNLAKKLANYTDIYINEAFSISHRNHTSLSLLPELVKEKGVGFQFEKEIQMLSPLVNQDLEKPLCVILGGSKLKDKIPLMEALINQADIFLIGGLMAYTFLKAKNCFVGKTLVETSSLNLAKNFIDRLELRNKDYFLPVDFKGQWKDQIKNWNLENFPETATAYDIGSKSIQMFQNQIRKAKSIFWNGPMGFFENEIYSLGTSSLAQFVANHKTAYRIVGGGHSALAVRQYEGEIDHISTGGGASLSYLQEKEFIGLKKLYTLQN